MKKGLALLLAASMAVSTFSSAAFAANEELTVKEKFDRLVEAGIFTGMPGGDPAVEDNMTRAQVAAVIQRLLDLPLDEEEALNDYKDLKWSEWAAGYIGAVSPEIMEGFGKGVFAPTRDVTYEELATILVRALDIEVNEDAEVEGTISDWAVEYVAAAIENGLIPEQDDYTVAAPRGVLISAAYAAYDIVNVPALAAIESAKPIGVQKVEVVFNKAIDTKDATLELKKGSSTIATKATFAEDGKSAVLELTNAKITKGEYTVTLGGIDELDAEGKTAKFEAEDERVEKLEFITPSDTIAHASSVIVRAQATNQYGEAASTNAGSYNVITSGADFKKISKAEDGTLLITLDTKSNDSLVPNVSIIPVTLVNTQTYMTVTKNFKLGNEPLLSKLEIGEAKYSVGDKLSGQGENVAFDLYFYDQYGNVITWEMYDREFKSNTQILWNTYVPDGTFTIAQEDNGNNLPQLKLSLAKNLDKSGDYTFTVVNQAANATGVVKVSSAKIATKVQIGSIDGVIATGDSDVYVPIIAFDEQGNELTADDLAEDENRDRIQITVSGATPATIENGKAKIEQSGPNKGKLKLKSIDVGPNGAVSVSAVIATANATSSDTRTFTVQKARTADRLVEAKAPAKQILPGAENKFQFNVYDNYDKKLDKPNNTTQQGAIDNSQATGTFHYYVEVSANVNGQGLTVTDDAGNTIGQTATIYSNGHGTDAAGNFETFNKDFKIVAANDASGSVEITATLYKKEFGKAEATELSRITRKVEVATKDTKLNYSVGELRTLYAALDNKSVTNSVYGDHANPTTSKLAAEVKINAKNAAGETVAIPAVVTQITSSDQTVAVVGIKDNKGYVIGNKAGSATINVVYRTNTGETKNATLPVTVKADTVVVEKLTSKDEVTADKLTGNVAELMDLKAVDNYGAEFSKNAVNEYNYLLGVTYTVQNVTGGSVVVDGNGNFTASGDGVAFDVTAQAPNGVSTTTTIKVDLD